MIDADNAQLSVVRQCRLVVDRTLVVLLRGPRRKPVESAPDAVDRRAVVGDAVLSNTLDPSFCVEALREALECYGAPEIFNTDQGSQFTSGEFTDVLKEAGIRISMDGKGRWMDNVFIERLWRSLKYECVYLSEFATGSEARTGIGSWIDLYDQRRPHSSLNDRTPDEAYTDDGADRSPGLRPVSGQPQAA